MVTNLSPFGSNAHTRDKIFISSQKRGL
jgi:hypothetical protein